MVNSASQSLAEFKSQRLGGLLSGTASTVEGPSIMGTSLADTASARLARSAPKKSSTAFLEQIRQSGQRLNQTALAGYQAQRQPSQQGSGYGSYALPSGGTPQTGGPRGAYGLTVPAGQAFNQLSAAAQKAGVGGLSIISGGRTREQQTQLYNAYKAGHGNKAAAPGTSLHESGIAADFGGAAHANGTAQHNWLVQNAANFGWYWVGARYGEAWHFEYHPEWKR